MFEEAIRMMQEAEDLAQQAKMVLDFNWTREYTER
jgi:hypothetical protein